MKRFNQSERAKALAQVPMFAGLSKKDRIEIARDTVEVRRPAGTVLTEEGADGNEAFLIISGNVAVTRKGRRLAVLGPGEVVGEMALLDQKERTASCKVVEDAVLLRLSSEDFNRLIERVPAMMRKLLVTLSLRLRDVDAKLVQ